MAPPALSWHGSRGAWGAYAHAAPAEHAIADVSHAWQHGCEGLALAVLQGVDEPHVEGHVWVRFGELVHSLLRRADADELDRERLAVRQPRAPCLEDVDRCHGGRP